jgi:hypothetical protein
VLHVGQRCAAFLRDSNGVLLGEAHRRPQVRRRRCGPGELVDSPACGWEIAGHGYQDVQIIVARRLVSGRAR